MGIKSIAEDLTRLRLLRRTIRALNTLNVQANVPRIAWRVNGDSPVDRLAEQAAGAVIRGQWTRNAFRLATIAVLQAQADAIVAQYPGLDTTE